ncbi:hypothetical protein, partial [Pseudoalteromonas distincta]|uniref:hypothetical protein n=1 Tax=Pseudoalteromonas distincta TaxID=77608 RepID=UPI0034E88328
LADDESAAVRLALVDNETLPLSILEKLSNDLDGRIARRAQSKLRKISSNEEGIAFGNLSGRMDSTIRVYDLCVPETDIAV